VGTAKVSLAMFSLENEGALVTGAASGIGRGIAIGLAEAGAEVTCLDRPGTDIAGTVDEIVRLGGRAVAVEADVTQEASLMDAITEHDARLRPLSVAVNAAGVAHNAPAEDLTVDDWQRVIDVDLTGVFRSCRAEGRAMLARRRGSIINIASISGTIINRGISQVHYNSAKAGVIQLTKSLAMEWAARGVRVNSISPGYTLTAMTQRPEARQRLDQFVSDTPLGRMAVPGDMVGPAVFLASSASSYCTGLDLIVDGGAVCW
jgi:NAD(P)-dependent dehydrogenase (short-subunit alcohol dehydrogenase family)